MAPFDAFRTMLRSKKGFWEDFMIRGAAETDQMRTNGPRDVSRGGFT
jgi:hypothetical protein